ncbi:hypothetical protein B0J17DRAFT_135286 [Rhizoctonia solani]|nr:hypothetical protein B0J17DRAFT_135286 [Rhizoctonia solani]
MASSPSSSKPKKGLRNLLRETLHVRSRSKSPSHPPGQVQRPDINPGPAKLASNPPSEVASPGTAHTSMAQQSLGRSDGRTGSEHALESTTVGSIPSMGSAVEILLTCLDDLEDCKVLARLRRSSYEADDTM